MKSIESKAGRVIVGKIEPNEDLIDSIVKIVKKHEIKSGFISVIGALKKTTIGYFNIETKQYNFKTIDEDVELISCTGNLSYKDGDPLIHLHVTIGREDYSLLGGHLSQPSIVSITGEVYIYEISHKLNRVTDPKLDLSLLDL